MAMFIHFFCLCPLSLTIKLNFDISKVAYSGKKGKVPHAADSRRQQHRSMQEHWLTAVTVTTTLESRSAACWKSLRLRSFDRLQSVAERVYPEPQCGFKVGRFSLRRL